MLLSPGYLEGTRGVQDLDLDSLKQTHMYKVCRQSMDISMPLQLVKQMPWKAPVTTP